MDAYLTGLHHALYAAGWTAGALTVPTLALLAVVSVFPLYRVTRRRLTSRRLHRAARASGRRS